MPVYRIMAELPWDSGLPEDVTVNVWHAIADDNVAVDLAMDNIVLFYNAIDAKLGDLLSSTVNACTITAYNLADPEPRAPQVSFQFTLTTGGISLPPEVAYCLSFQAAQVSGSPQARRRGRIYLGPIAAAESSGGRPSNTGTGIVPEVQLAAQALLTASEAAATWSWAVYSPTDGVARAVDNGWCDDEFDTQRRRGRERTVRRTFT